MPSFVMFVLDVYELSSSFRIDTAVWILLLVHEYEITLQVLPRTTRHQLITYIKWNKTAYRRCECITHSC
jgi:hypothetical protein